MITVADVLHVRACEKSSVVGYEGRSNAEFRIGRIGPFGGCQSLVDQVILGLFVDLDCRNNLVRVPFCRHVENKKKKKIREKKKIRIKKKKKKKISCA